MTIYTSPDIVPNKLFVSCDTMTKIGILHLPGNKDERLLEEALPLKENWWETIEEDWSAKK